MAIAGESVTRGEKIFISYFAITLNLKIISIISYKSESVMR
jgi:cell division protein FtsL